MNADVILVDSTDHETGVMSKSEVHEKGLLHRAFSVFIFNSKGELLLQQRATGKYHSGGLWTNTCCSHPKPGERTLEAAEKRLNEEMGICCFLMPAFTFTYKVKFENGLSEHEFDHVFIGTSDQLPIIDKSEVENWKYVAMDALAEDLERNPERFTEWLKLCFQKVRSYKKQDNTSDSGK